MLHTALPDGPLEVAWQHAVAGAMELLHEAMAMHAVIIRELDKEQSHQRVEANRPRCH